MKTYKTRALALRKTKLGEKDLIIDLLDQSGSLIRGVAKGARKPGGSLAARVELFTVADLMLASGRTLDVICEARRVAETGLLELSLEQAACASPVAELLAQVAQPDLPQPRLFDLGCSAMSHIASAEQPTAALLMTAAALWKIVSQAGFRPSLSTCAICSDPVFDGDGGGEIAVSMTEGGSVCTKCMRPPDAVLASGETLKWCEALIVSRFDDIAGFEADAATVFSVIDLFKTWSRVHVGRPVKSIDFLATAGVF